MSNTNKNNRRRGNRANNRRGPRKGQLKPSSGNMVTRDNPRFPNDVKQIPIHNRVIRYLSTNTAATSNITPGDILRSVGYQLNATTTYYPIFGSIRLRRVSLYFVPSTGDFGSDTNEISFAWTGVQNAPSNLITDRGTAYMPACIKVKPPQNSVAAMWFDSSSPTLANNLFTINCPSQTIMDIDFDFTMARGSAPSTLTLSAVSTLTGVGIITLDNGGSIWKPDGFPYIHV